jgi:hypothetical protein
MLRASVALAMILYAAMLSAAEVAPADKRFELHGFGTLGAVYHNAPGGILYRRDISQTVDGARAGHLSSEQDSMLGVQVTSNLNNQFSASVQVMSRLDVYDTFAPQISMAYLKFQEGETFVRLGRLVAETYMKGDSAEVGYANLLVRQPIVFYPRMFEGLDAETTQPLGQGLLRIKGAAGSMVGKLISAGGPVYDTGGSRGGGGAVEYSLSGWTGRFSVYTLKLKNELDALQPGGELAAALPGLPNGAQFFNVASMKDRRLTYKLLGLAYDAGAIQGGAGWSALSTHDWPVARSLYAFAGYRIEQLTPYFAYSVQTTPRQFAATGIPYGMSAATDALNQVLAQGQTGVWLNQTDFGLGMRYDFARNKALKFQLEHIRYQDPQSIVDPGLSTAPAETRGYKVLNLYSIALDFVF